MDNVTLCSCCGQERPFPTEPGIWEFCEDPLFNHDWVRCIIERHEYPEEGMTVTPIGSDEPIWWPKDAKWRKVE